jgi:hypothetical protein
MSFGIGNYEAVVSAHLPRKTEKLCKTRQGITTIPQERSSHHTPLRGRERAFSFSRSLSLSNVHYQLVLCSSWMHFLFGFLIHSIVMREIAQSLWHGSVVCSVGRLSKTRNRQLSGYQGGHHRREIDPPPVIIRAVLRFHNRGSQHFEKSKNYLNYCQFWPVLWWKSSVLWGLWNNRNWLYLFFDSDYFQKPMSTVL